MLEKFLDPNFIKSLLIIFLIGYALIVVAPKFYPKTETTTTNVRDPEKEKQILDATYKIGFLQAEIQMKDSLIKALEEGNINIINTGTKKKTEYKNLSSDKQVEKWNEQFNKLFNRDR